MTEKQKFICQATLKFKLAVVNEYTSGGKITKTLCHDVDAIDAAETLAARLVERGHLSDVSGPPPHIPGVR